ncbi:MAG: SH3 domain-containing protein [Saprospiraceae bacterium]|nr:SH3 domain-containing protein [Saprospiraceae bacterium]
MNDNLLNVRSGPNKNKPVLRTVNFGTEINIYASDPSG